MVKPSDIAMNITPSERLLLAPARLQAKLLFCSVRLAPLAGLVLTMVSLSGCSTDPLSANSGQALLSPRDMQAELTISKGSMDRAIGNAEMLRQLHPASVEIDDPVYGKRKRYSGYWLMDVFRLAGVQMEQSDVWTFQALDGYEARISAADALGSNARPFLAIRDLDAPSGWERIRQGKALISPGPFYMVWQEASSGSATGRNRSLKLPWPYQLASVRFRNRDEAQRKLFPGDSSTSASVARGFTVFQQNCLACHSLNLEGGTLGPELNIPRNIMQYRERTYLREFISNPGSFRARSKMPAFKESLSAGSMDDLFSYLDWIGGHKIQTE